MTSLESVLEFIEESRTVTVNYREKGYRIHCNVSDQEKWNTPNIQIIITNCHLPERECSVTVEYRKGIIFESEDEDVVFELIDKLAKKVKEVNKVKEELLHDEFSQQLEVFKK